METQWKSALVWHFSEDALKTLQTLRSWISKKIDRNYSMHFTDQKTETGVWETLPPLKGINIGQVSINGNKKAENLRNWRMVEQNNCGDTLPDTDGEFCRELKELQVHHFLTSTCTHLSSKCLTRWKETFICLPECRAEDKHITPKSCSRVKPEALQSLEELHTTVFSKTVWNLCFSIAQSKTS